MVCMISTQPAIMQKLFGNIVLGREAVIGVEILRQARCGLAHVGHSGGAVSDEQQMKASELAQLWVALSHPATGKIAVILRQLMNNGLRRQSGLAGGEPHCPAINFDQEQRPFAALPILKHKARIRHDLVFGSEHIAHIVSGFFAPICTDLLPPILNEGVNQRIVLQRLTIPLEISQSVKRGDAVIHKWRPAAADLDGAVCRNLAPLLRIFACQQAVTALGEVVQLGRLAVSTNASIAKAA